MEKSLPPEALRFAKKSHGRVSTRFAVAFSLHCRKKHSPEDVG
jgi:hypothetical protein